jgi:hypothetical protein
MSSTDPKYFQAVDRDILAIQLLEASIVLLQRIRKYADENGIRLTDGSQVDSLLARARNIIEELDKTETEEFNRRKVTGFRTDDKVPVPFHALYKGGYRKKSHNS